MGAASRGCGPGSRFRRAAIARRLSAEWRAEWRERLVRFRGWTGTSGEFCWREGISRLSLLSWAKQLRVPMTARSRPGTSLVRVRAKPEADRSPFAAVRIRPVPVKAGATLCLKAWQRDHNRLCCIALRDSSELTPVSPTAN
jgi:hypothetical protein